MTFAIFKAIDSVLLAILSDFVFVCFQILAFMWKQNLKNIKKGLQVLFLQTITLDIEIFFASKYQITNNGSVPLDTGLVHIKLQIVDYYSKPSNK